MDKREAFIKDFWQKRGSAVAHPRIATHFRIDDAINYDFNLVSKFCTPHTKILDLGAGTCTLASLLAPHVNKIVAVDFISSFLEREDLPSNIERVTSDIRTLEVKEEYDVILLFGVLNYFFNNSEIITFYKKCKKMLVDNGSCIIKHQAGIKETVYVDHFSEEINSQYLAVYRYVQEEITMLKEVFPFVELVDVYPPELNRWDNTHFYAFVCK